MQRKGTRFTVAQRLAIIKEYETSPLSGKEIAQNYGLKGPNIICMWRTRLQESSKNDTFAADHDTKVAVEEPMKEKSRAELESELAKVKKELEWAKLQNLALNTMIDIAEEQGIRIRKKSGAKQ